MAKPPGDYKVARRVCFAQANSSHTIALYAQHCDPEGKIVVVAPPLV
jgi:hypothetical protein